MPRSLRRAWSLAAAVLGGAAVLFACSGDAGRATRATTTVPPALSTAADPSAAPTPSEPGVGGPVPTTVRPAGPPPITSAQATETPPMVGTLPSGEVRIRDAEVESVDRAGGTFTLVGRPSGYAVVVVTGSTVFTLAEGDPATFAHVEPGAVVAVTGTAGGPGQLTARRVVVLG